MKATAAQRRRLKALHWDKIRAPQAGTVWSQAAGRQLKLDFDQLESLFQARRPARVRTAPTAPLPGLAHAERRWACGGARFMQRAALPAQLSPC